MEPEHPSFPMAMQQSVEQLSAYAAMRVAGDVHGLENLVKNDMFGQLACAAAGISSSIPHMQLTVTPQISGNHADMHMNLGEIIAQASPGEHVITS